ncbi:hypothetical protein [Lentzea sp. CA-135723]|uniref:hypothetical protein n=1 Tax=Lentzea sp. CA-135723 TaxID=3239950 RepID=UPI003D8C903F
MNQPLAMPHALVITATLCFTVWLIDHGYEPFAAALTTLGTVAGAVAVTSLSWRGAVVVLRRLTSSG